MKNKETLEEAAESYANTHQDVSGNLGQYLVKSVFQDGAQWQQERMYSEEEVSEIAKDAYTMGRNNILIGVFNKWFNEFKKL